MSSQSSSKRQKTTKDSTDFHGIGKIEFNASSTNDSIDNLLLTYRHFNGTERLHGRTMSEWLRFAIDFHSICQSHNTSASGNDVPTSNWDVDSVSIDNNKAKIKSFFELLTILGVKHWTALDTDLFPQGDTWDETFRYADEIIEYILELQQRSNIKLLWLATNPHLTIFKNGAATNPDPAIYCYYGMRLRKCLEASFKLGAECFLVDGSIEGFSTIWSSDVQLELKNLAKMLKMVVEFKEQIGYDGQLILNVTNSVENPKFNAYIYDAYSGISFLKHFNLDRYFKLNVSNPFDLTTGLNFGSVGSISWSSDCKSIKKTCWYVKMLLQNGLGHPGAIVINSFPMEYVVEQKHLVQSLVSTIDLFAKSLKTIIRMYSEAAIPKSVQPYYVSQRFPSVHFMNTLSECDEQIRKVSISFKQLNGQHHHQHSQPKYWSILMDRFFGKN